MMNDFENICRICLKKDNNLFPINNDAQFKEGLTYTNAAVTIIEIINECTKYPVQHFDQLPFHICSRCKEAACIAYLFKRQTEESYCRLKSIVDACCRKAKAKTTKFTIPEKPLQTEKKMLKHPIEHLLLDDPKRCPVCGRFFAKSYGVRRHLRNVHKLRRKQQMRSLYVNKTLGLEREGEEEYNTLDEYSVQPLKANLESSKHIIPENYCKVTESNESKDVVSEAKQLCRPSKASTSDISKNEELPTTNLMHESKCFLDKQEEENLEDKNEILKETTTPKTNQNTIKRNSSSKKETIICEQCGRVCISRKLLLRHLACHKDTKPYACSSCDKSFKRSEHLRRHVTSKHNDLKLFKCDRCTAAYKDAFKLQHHKATRHDKQFACDLCVMKFTTITYLNKHKRLQHDRAHPCEHCSETFMDVKKLKEHQKTAHAFLRDYLCSVCGLRFRRKEFLNIHMRRHTGERPYKCKLCDKGFPRSTDLKMHERYHLGIRPHLCNVCGKGFHRPYSLAVHMRTHTGEKPYKCSQCSQAFVQSNDLKTHMRHHTGEPFRCYFCEATFGQRYGLRSHLKAAHGIHVLKVPFTNEMAQKELLTANHQRKELVEEEDKGKEKHAAIEEVLTIPVNDPLSGIKIVINSAGPRF